MDKNQIEKNSQYPLYNFDENKKAFVPGFRLVEIDNTYEPTGSFHYHNFWELFIIFEGSGHHYIDFEVYPIKPGQAYCIGRGQLHKVEPEGNLRGYFLMFDELFYSQLHLRKFQLQSFSSLSKNGFEMSKEIELQVRLLKQIIAKGSAQLVEVVKSLVKALLLLIEDLLEKEVENLCVTNDSLVGQFFNELDSPTLKSRFVRDYAKCLNISESYLNELIKKHTGFPAQHWVKRRVLIEAKRYLAYSKESIETISDFLQFPDAASFCRFFKGKEGLTPLKWKAIQ